MPENQPYRAPQRANNNEKKPKKRLKAWHKVLIVVLAVVLLVVLAGGIFVYSKLHKMERVKTPDEVSVDTSMVVEFDPSENEGEPEGDYKPAEPPEGDMFSDKNIVNILLLGTDERSTNFSTNARADSIMLLSLNKSTNSIKLVSFQRGTAVPVPGRDDDWLTHTFAYGGADLTVKTVEECFLVEIDGYVRVNFATFAQLVDSVGGVEITLTAPEVASLNDEIYTNAVARATVHEGVNLLDGYDALQYSRLRYIDSDWYRIERQRNVIKSIFNGMKSLSLLEINALLDECLPLVQTNLTDMQILSLMWYAEAFLSGDIDEMSLPKRGTFYGAEVGGGKILNVTDFTTNAEILREFLQS